MKIRTLQCEIQRLKSQTVIEISKNIVSPSVTLFEKGTHVKRAGSVLYLDQCAKMLATITKLPFCKEEFPVLVEGQIFSSIRYMDPSTKILYHNYTIAACNQPALPKCCQIRRRQFSTIWRNACEEMNK